MISPQDALEDMGDLNPMACALFLLAAFVLAGFAQTAWLRSRLSRSFRIPIDGGSTLRGRRLFGDHKTWAGVVVMVPAVGLACSVLALGRQGWPFAWGEGVWPLSVGEYALLGCWLGVGFMGGELPNSFVKRQCGIASGTLPRRRFARTVCLVVDRLDSVVGATLALLLVLPVPLMTILAILILGPGLHGLFSLFLYQLGVKARPT